MRALVVANGYDADPGFVGEHLRGAGYAFTECHREHPEDWPDLDGVQLVAGELLVALQELGDVDDLVVDTRTHEALRREVGEQYAPSSQST